MFGGAIKFGDCQMKFSILQNGSFVSDGEIIDPYITNEEAKKISSQYVQEEMSSITHNVYT